MDMQTPDHAPAPPAASSAPSDDFVEHLLDMLAAATPGASGDNACGRARSRARELFDAFNPRDAAEAQLAAIAVAAALSAMDSFVRSAQPGISAETVVRLRGNGLAAGRTYAAALRTLRKPSPGATRTKPAAAQPPKNAPTEAPVHATAEVPPGFIALRPGAKPIPAVVTFQPRDRFGEPIPDLRTDLMTRAQLRASLAIPRDPKLEAEALAEEEAMMAEQAALDARGEAKEKTGGSTG
jgi:hypothetical protein